MKRWLRFWPLALGACITYPLYLLVAMVADGGRGSYLPATLVFPVGMSLAMLMHRIPIAAFVLGAVQFPLYGYWFNKTSRKWWFLKWLLIAHGLWIFIAFLLDDGGVFIQF